MPDEIYDHLIQPRGAAYRASQLKSNSHYLEPVEQSEGRLAGHSRVWGDASPAVQSRSIDALVEAARDVGLGARDTAHVLAIARIESGFNPDAAAGTTSASGLGQFVDDTGRHYGLGNANRFDVNAQAGALVAHFIDNRNLAQRRGQDASWIYKYHHDGPTLDYGGLALSREKVMPLLDDYTRFVEERFGIRRTAEDLEPPADVTARTATDVSDRSEALRHGQRGNGVAELQATLAGLGYHDARGAPLQTDGLFGPRTTEAVRAFQQAQGLDVDGIVGPATRGALEQVSRLQRAEPSTAGHAPGAAALPLEVLLAAAKSGDPAALKGALDDFSKTDFGRTFAVQIERANEPAPKAPEVAPEQGCAR